MVEILNQQYPDNDKDNFNKISSEQILFGLDPQQLQAATSLGGLVRIKAGAGTGKTRVLTTRCVYLTQVLDIDPGKILGTTFTVKAAREMRERVLNIGGEKLKDIRLATVHSLASRLLRKYWQAAGFESKEFLIADTEDSYQVMLMAVDNSRVLGDEQAAEFKKQRKEYAESCVDKISRWKENGIGLKQIEHKKDYNFADQDFITVYKEYQKLMMQRNLVDFSDLTLKAVELLQNNANILKTESESIEYLMVDEFQDTNKIQLLFLELLSSKNKNLMVVGDDDQSLYSFRGSIPRLMDRLAEMLPTLSADGIKDVCLITNRRCTEQVLAPANLLVDYNRRDQPKVLLSGREGLPVVVKAYPTCKMEAAGVATDIKILIDKGVKESEIAILSRTGYILNTIGTALIEARIPHQMQAGTGLLERAEIKDVLAYLKLAIDPTLDIAFERIAARPIRGLGVSAVEVILKLSKDKQIPIYEALARIADTRTLKAPGQKGAAQLGQQLSILSDAARRQENSEDIIQYVLNTIGYSAWASEQKDCSPTLNSSFEILTEIARERVDFGEFLNDMCLFSDHEERARDGVHVGTMHGSKGLEWEHVFLVGFEEGIIPNARALKESEKFTFAEDDPWNTNSAGGLEEERRLAHVGMTRSKESLSISFANVRGIGQMRKDARPSRFLREAELQIPRAAKGIADTRMVIAKGKNKISF